MRDQISTDVDPMPAWAVWRGAKVPVWNHLPAAWRWRVRELVDACHQSLPDPAPRLVLHDMNAIRCEALPNRLTAHRGMTICLADKLEDPLAAAMTYLGNVANHVLRRVMIQLHARRADPGEDPLCHELMPALTGIDDHAGRPQPHSSCVWGELLTPGLCDEHVLRWVSRQDAARRRRDPG